MKRSRVGTTIDIDKQGKHDITYPGYGINMVDNGIFKSTLPINRAREMLTQFHNGTGQVIGVSGRSDRILVQWPCFVGDVIDPSSGERIAASNKVTIVWNARGVHMFPTRDGSFA